MSTHSGSHPGEEHKGNDSSHGVGRGHPGHVETHDHPHPHGHDDHGHDHDSAHGDHDHGSSHSHDHGDHDHDHGDGGHDHDHGSGLWAKVKHAITPHSHDAVAVIQTAEESSSEGIRAAWIGLAGMGATAIMQIVIVAVSGSIALLADTLHNVGHAVTTIPLVIAFRIGQRAASSRFSYGYRRAEDLVGLLIGLVIAISAGVIIWESVRAVIDPPELTNLGWVFAAGIVGALGNEIVAIYRIRAGKRIGSASLVAEGNHARADGLTSIAVVLGVIGVWLGFPQADAIVGFGIAIVILGILVATMRTTIRRLMDGIEPGLIERMEQVAGSVPGVVEVGRVRARWTGHRLEADTDIVVESSLSILEGHQVAEEVQHALLHRIPHLEGVVVHLNPAVNGSVPADVHDLTGHHVSAEARRAYQQRRSES